MPIVAGEFEVFCGLDVARETHHAVALDPGGRRLGDRPLPNAEAELVELFAELEAHGRVLVMIDQLASIGALAIAVARSRGIAVAHLPGLAMRRIADLYPGEAKTDARDAYVIADAARTLPHALRRVGFEEQTTVELTVLAGYDADLAQEATRLTNRLHDALARAPGAGTAVGQVLSSPGRPAAASRHRTSERHRSFRAALIPLPWGSRAQRGTRSMCTTGLVMVVSVAPSAVCRQMVRTGAPSVT